MTVYAEGSAVTYTGSREWIKLVDYEGCIQRSAITKILIKQNHEDQWEVLAYAGGIFEVVFRNPEKSSADWFVKAILGARV